MNLHRALLATTGFSLLLTGGRLQSQQLAGNWKIVPAPAIGSAELYATDVPVWKVREDGAVVTASHWTRRDREEQEKTFLPEHLTRDALMHGAPSSLRLDGGGWLIGFDVHEVGTADTLASLPYGPIVARSIVIAADRTIYVGVRGYILRLLPQPNGYTLQWLLPDQPPKG
jgi:hypothetical protein